jgi:hypothetical protein
VLLLSKPVRFRKVTPSTLVVYATTAASPSKHVRIVCVIPSLASHSHKVQQQHLNAVSTMHRLFTRHLRFGILSSSIRTANGRDPWTQ